jgi:hypothetical protein
MNSVSRFLSFDIKNMYTHILNSDQTKMFKKNFKICTVIKLQMKFFQCFQSF